MNIKLNILFFLVVILVSACGSKTPQSKDNTTPMIETKTSTDEPTPVSTIGMDDPPPSGAEREFVTDFSKHSVPYSEIFSGGPTKDGIPALDKPVFISVDEADPWLANVEPVIYVQVEDDARAYPIQILIWHEIVNDTVGGMPLTITFCPLCNTAIAFEREVDSQILDFGTTGRLRYSNLIMYDRQTETWWQQGTGEAIVGELLGTQLNFYPASIVAWEDFAAAFPAGRVLSKETGFDRRYGENPYYGYDDINNSPFLFRGEITGQLAAMERVLALDSDGEIVAYPYSILSAKEVIHDQVGNEKVVVFWVEGTASALDTIRIFDGRDVGSANAFSPILDGEELSFSPQGDLFKDNKTGSLWNILGQAINGPLTGKSLKPLTAVNHFWFDWVAFRPETRVYESGN